MFSNTTLILFIFTLVRNILLCFSLCVLRQHLLIPCQRHHSVKSKVYFHNQCTVSFFFSFSFDKNHYWGNNQALKENSQPSAAASARPFSTPTTEEMKAAELFSLSLSLVNDMILITTQGWWWWVKGWSGSWRSDHWNEVGKVRQPRRERINKLLLCCTFSSTARFRPAMWILKLLWVKDVDSIKPKLPGVFSCFCQLQ